MSATMEEKVQEASNANEPLGDTTQSTNKPRTLAAMLHVSMGLLPYKLYYLCIGGALGAIIPYYGVYFKQLGFTGFEIGIIIGARALVGFIFGPIICGTANKIQQQKTFLIISLLSLLAMTALIGFLPSVDSMKCAGETSRHTNYTKNVTFRAGIQTRPVNNTRINTLHLEDVSFPGTFANESKSKRSLIPKYKNAEHYRNENNNNLAAKLSPRNSHRAKLDIKIVEFGETHSRTIQASRWPVGFNGLIQDRWFYEKSSRLYDKASLHHIFVTVLIVIVVGELLSSAHLCLSGTATLSHLGEENFYKLGHQLVWQEIMASVMSLVTGVFLQIVTFYWLKCGNTLIYTDYKIAFYVAIAWNVLALIMVVMGFDYTHVMPIKSLHSLKAVAAFLMSFYYMSILLTSFFMGACNGVIVSFLYMYLEDLGAVPLLLGIASFISLSSNVLMYIFVHDVIEVIGHIWVIMCGLGGYTVRFIIYSQIYNPWFVLPGECLQGISSAAISIALTSYFAADVPTVSMTTIQGILYMMHMGLGTFAGNLIGGALYDLYGARTMFLLFGITSCTVLVIFFFALRVTEKPKFPEPDCKTYLELEGINTNKKNVGKETKEDN